MNKWYEGLDQKPTAELQQLRDQLAMKYDDELSGVLNEDPESQYTERDLDFWDRVIHSIIQELNTRLLCPYCGATDVRWIDHGGAQESELECQQCAQKHLASERVYRAEP